MVRLNVRFATSRRSALRHKRGRGKSDGRPESDLRSERVTVPSRKRPAGTGLESTEVCQSKGGGSFRQADDNDARRECQSPITTGVVGAVSETPSAPVAAWGLPRGQGFTSDRLHSEPVQPESRTMTGAEVRSVTPTAADDLLPQRRDCRGKNDELCAQVVNSTKVAVATGTEGA